MILLADPLAPARPRPPADVDAVREQLCLIAERHGFAEAVYMHLGRETAAAGAGQTSPRRLVATGALDEAAYRDRGYLRTDPLIRRALRAFLPFVWSLDQLADEMEAEAAGPVLDAFRGWGLLAGVMAPVQDHANGPAFLNLFGAHADPLLIEPGALMLDAWRLHAALRVQDLAACERAPYELNRREIEVLHQAALGRTEPETGLALGLSRRGVQFHLARSMAKLGASNKTAAVARAIKAGLVSL